MMKFEIDASMSFNVVVPDEFVHTMREAAQADDASDFLKYAEGEYPDDDPGFVLCILRNGLKRHLRGTTVQLLEASGLGGTFSPVKLKDRTPPQGEAVLASDIGEAIPA